MGFFMRYSSITQKITMSVAGIILMAFLLVHLGINLFILPLSENHKEVFREAVHFMTVNPLVKIMEIVLIACFLIHIIWGVVIQIQNWVARGTHRYKVTNWSQTSFFSKFMIYTGIIVLIFLGIHFMNFYFVKLGWISPPEGMMPVADKHDFYSMAVNLFNNDVYSVIYIILMVFLGFHLNHSFQSAFQTLGLNHPVYTPVIKAFGDIYSIVVPLGFAIIPLYFIIYF